MCARVLVLVLEFVWCVVYVERECVRVTDFETDIPTLTPYPTHMLTLTLSHAQVFSDAAMGEFSDEDENNDDEGAALPPLTLVCLLLSLSLPPSLPSMYLVSAASVSFFLSMTIQVT